MGFPKDDITRAILPGPRLREAPDGDAGDTIGTIAGHLAVFDEWAEIDSLFEGHFMERFAPGTFDKTLREGRDRVRMLFDHGFDPQIGNKVLAPFDRLEPDDEGLAFEGGLFDTSYNRDLLPGLKAGQYGASIRFRVMRDEVVKSPKPTTRNPRGLPERTVKEAQLFEGGPVTFPAYAGASAKARSMTDWYRDRAGLVVPDRSTWTPAERRRVILETMK
jgi:HK97 family phage prohead protease